MDELLKNNELEHLIENFKEEKITPDVLLQLADSHIEKLCPAIGDQLRLRRLIHALSSAKKVSVSDLNSLDYQEQGNEPEIIVENITPLRTPQNPVIIQEIFAEEPPQKIPKLNDDILLVLNTESGPSTSSLTTTETWTSGPSSSSLLTTAESWTSDHVLESADVNNSLNDTLQVINLNLKELLLSNALGRVLLLKGQKNKKLTFADRNCLSEIIISYFLNKNIKLDNSSISCLAEKIVEVFSDEKRETYYVSPITKRRSLTNKPITAKGKLIDKYRNRTYALKKALGITKPTEQPHDIEIPSREAVDSQIWLKHNVEPRDEVLVHWTNSFNIRANRTALSSIENFFTDWPILETQWAPDLVDYDFRQMFQVDIDIQEAFLTFFDRLLEAKRKQLSAIDATLLELLNTEITQDSKNAIKIHLISSLIPPRSSTRIKRQVWKPSSKEARDGLLLHVLTPADLSDAKQKRTDYYYNKGLTIQPYMVLVGPTLGNVSSFYVVVDNHTYKLSSVLSALDFCFKVHHVLDAQYSFECRHLWYVIQWYVYNLKTKNDLKIPYVQNIF
ncbi:hypothetical protein PPYR_15581 [Photinus pyralis]|uniref:SAM domain-containing protein n=1 Tax=Photinus pyralis TaxID=7054 RepID=A0A5N3ZYG1_PHOPY|nr:uncharacterized protein LOC116165058 isoform X1 [Photinus pyralis]XP_031359140.1 uncharacterized protein LOC116182737 isoform X1 [Photinus pyralis]KAB0790100.1 hypothetical protein PPYR_15581 [Photinus pyralis]